ncbi:hypothetical protein Zmor_010256 [Zophobas morio]|uniref:Uncharacterized protein n=1 Tax=Zophobas morio TaxID=2755281 RepID=A0AA38MJI0_9CUCU|nr:hypothetical protein Zmor_010256 [Zophobas morio]
MDYAWQGFRNPNRSSYELHLRSLPRLRLVTQFLLRRAACTNSRNSTPLKTRIPRGFTNSTYDHCRDCTEGHSSFYDERIAQRAATPPQPDTRRYELFQNLNKSGPRDSFQLVQKPDIRGLRDSFKLLQNQNKRCRLGSLKLL